MRNDRTGRFFPRLSLRLRTGLLIGAAAFAFASAALVGAQEHQHGAARPAAPAKKGAPPAAQNNCAVCIEKSVVLNPNMYSSWNDQEVKKAYQAAQKYPATMDLLHCFCECKESPREHHKSLLTCFTTEHAAGCGVCQHEAIMAGKMKDEGASDEEVEYTVESLHKTDGHPPTKGRGI